MTASGTFSNPRDGGPSPAGPSVRGRDASSRANDHARYELTCSDGFELRQVTDRASGTRLLADPPYFDGVPFGLRVQTGEHTPTAYPSAELSVRSVTTEARDGGEAMEASLAAPTAPIRSTPAWNKSQDEGYQYSTNIALSLVQQFPQSAKNYNGQEVSCHAMRSERKRREVLASAVLPLAYGSVLGVGGDSSDRETTASLTQSDGTLRPVVDDGFGNPNNIGIDRVYAAQGFLFAAASNIDDGASVWRSADGETWERITPNSINGDVRRNNSIVSLHWFDDHLYVAPWDIERAYDPEVKEGAYLFRGKDTSKDENRAKQPTDEVNEWNWETITSDAFGELYDQAFVGLQEFKGYLYSGTFNFRGPSPGGGPVDQKMLRSPTGGPDPDDWEQVAPVGFGHPECTTDAHHSLVYDGHLYYGTEKAGCVGTAAGELWRTDGDVSPSLDHWEQMSEPGFGRIYNNNIFDLVVHDDYLFCCTWGWGAGAEVWRANLSTDLGAHALNWEQINVTGFGNPQNSWANGIVTLNGTLYVCVMDPFGPGMGFLAKNPDPTAPAPVAIESWEEITGEGWPPEPGPNDSPLAGPYDLGTFKGKVYMPYHSSDFPGQLWAYDPGAG